MNAMAAQRPLEILLVDDSLADVTLIREALAGGRLSKNISVVADGVEALLFLHRQGSYTQAVRPDLVLLDLNLSKKDGREVLLEVKADPQLRSIPVVILTSSHSQEDARRCYELQANSVVTKPLELDDLVQTMWSIEKFWFNTARLPESE